MRRSTFRTCLVALLALAVLAPISAQAPATVALSDFVVNSENPSYKYIGKGFAEIVAFELKKAPQIKLVDREQRNKLLDEMEFSLSGLTDPSTQLEIGKLLSVQYLVSGSITDMGGPLLVSLTMVDVQTGEVVWNDQLSESGNKYAYIGAYFGKSLLQHFNASVSKDTEKTLAAAREGDAASVVALSRGIAALDEGNKDEAKKQLTAAKKIDPGNAVAQAFLSKLASASAKFKVVPERYVSYFNPAYLGGMEKNRTYFNYSQGNVAWGEINTNKGDGPDNWVILNEDGSYATFDAQKGFMIGYQMPIDEKLGLGFELSMPTLGNSLQAPITPDEWYVVGNDYYSLYGGKLSCGIQLRPSLNLGIGLGLNYRKRSYSNDFLGDPPPELADPDIEGYWLQESLDFIGFIAAAAKSSSGALAWDFVASWSNEELYYFDTDLAPPGFVGYGSPLYIEQTLSWSLNGQKTFLAFKQANDIYFDRDLYYGRLMPCVEQWFFNLFSIRLGAEGSIVARDGAMELGWGATAGATVKVWKLEMDVNYTLRQRPSRTLAGVTIPEYVLFVTLSADGLLFN
jgi:TolB-like protein